MSSPDARPSRRRARFVLVFLGAFLVVGLIVGSAIGATHQHHHWTGPTPTAGAAPVPPPRPSPSASASATKTGAPVRSHRPTTRTSRPPATTPATVTTAPAIAGRAFAGVTVGVDPGHNGGNFSHAGFINHLIWNGREKESCNTTGTATDNGYTEALYNFRVASYLAEDLRRAGAHIVMTRTSNDGVGPCVNRRAGIINASHAAVAIDIHADGGPASGRGFTVLEPVADGVNNAVVAASRRYGALLRDAFETTGMPTSTYDGTDGITYRDDLAGLNLTTVPQVLIETGNMRNAEDAALLTSTAFQRKAAQAIMLGMKRFLFGGR